MNRTTAQNSPLSRREWMKLAALGASGYCASGWLERVARAAANNPQRKRSCILLWMNGGPSQIDTFDPKPDHENGGSFQSIKTAVPGIQIAEHLPKVAREMSDMVLIRSMSTKEGDHGRATHLMRTGYLQQGPIHYPTLGSIIANELGSSESTLPDFVSVAPFRFFNPAAHSSGFLGPSFAPLVVGDANQRQGSGQLAVQNLTLPKGVSEGQADSRLALLGGLQSEFTRLHSGPALSSHQYAYDRAVRMMRSDASAAFEIDQEPDQVRDSYGRNQFGEGCLLARRLVERGVPFVEVTLSNIPNNNVFGWDTHQNNFEEVKRLCEVLDPAWSSLMKELRERGLLESTLIVWMGEFGRTPRIVRNNGRDHYPAAWSTVLAGGGLRSGQVIGDTGKDGSRVQGKPVSVSELLATVCRSLGIDHTRQNMSNVGRPIPIVEHGTNPIDEVLS